MEREGKLARYTHLPEVDGQGIVDLHVHAGPELLRRRYDPFTLAEEARRSGIGVVIKNHFVTTTSWAMLARRSEKDPPIIGSVTLNHPLGGVDEHGIRAALSGLKRDPGSDDPADERFIVWMPTIQAEAHLAKFGRHDIPLAWGVAEKYCSEFPPGGGLSVFDEVGELSAGAGRVIRSVVEHDLILATGHLDRRECKAMIAAAHRAGARRIIITHPLWDVTEFSTPELVQLWNDHGAYSELCYVNLAECGIDHCRMVDYIDVIRSVGPQGVILTTDLGQASQPGFADGFRRFLELLAAEGIAEDDLIQMSIINPRHLLLGARANPAKGPPRA